MSQGRQWSLGASRDGEMVSPVLIWSKAACSSRPSSKGWYSFAAAFRSPKGTKVADEECCVEEGEVPGLLREDTDDMAPGRDVEMG